MHFCRYIPYVYADWRKCVKCGFEENADYNASQNIAIKNIGEIIKETLKNQNKIA